MGYMHIPNLYADQTILLFRECYALEKIHGTSATVSWRAGQVRFHAGGESYDRFRALFDEQELSAGFLALGHDTVVVHGEAYGGKQQAQSWRYGPNLRFVAFDVRVGDLWLAVPSSLSVVNKLGLEFVHHVLVPADLTVLDAERDAPSEQARRNGVEGDKPREGVVLRPPIEVTLNNGERVVAKHKRQQERETATLRSVVDPKRAEALKEADAIAEEWVTLGRLRNARSHFPEDQWSERNLGNIIKYMVEDVTREGGTEIVMSTEAAKAIGRRTSKLFRKLPRADSENENL